MPFANTRSRNMLSKHFPRWFYLISSYRFETKPRIRRVILGRYTEIQFERSQDASEQF